MKPFFLIIFFLTCKGIASNHDDIEILKKRVSSLESKQNSMIKATQVQVGGRVQLDITTAWPEGSLTPGGIPLKKEGEDGQLGANIRDSRLWIKSKTPSGIGMVRTVAEVNFYGESGNEINKNAHGVALRYFYVALGDFKAGQANSLFTTYITPITLVYPLNHTFARQPLLAYSYEYSSVFTYDFSLEQPESYLSDPSGSQITPQDDQVPDLLARVRYYPSWGRMACAGIARYIVQDRARLSDGTQLENRDALWGFGLNASAKINLYALDNLYFGLQYGNAIGRYFTINAYSDGRLDSAGKIKLNTMLGTLVGYQRWWTSILHSNIVYTRTSIEEGNENAEDTTDTSEAWQINLIYSPIKNGRIGVEYAYGNRELLNKESGDMRLVRLQIRYDF
ncbi:MAG: DcaP family trimeric outer membrane transporter [Campylobacterota bacterium]|nr:DcaP family trimeric outer membrane transporter [Campylobacterota bacterium]